MNVSFKEAAIAPVKILLTDIGRKLELEERSSIVSQQRQEKRWMVYCLPLIKSSGICDHSEKVSAKIFHLICLNSFPIVAS